MVKPKEDSEMKINSFVSYILIIAALLILARLPITGDVLWVISILTDNYIYTMLGVVAILLIASLIKKDKTNKDQD